MHVTSNNFYHEICEIQTQLTDLAASDDPLLSTMAVSMRGKYNKYWGNVDNINPLLFLAVILDPRYKMGYLKYCFDSVYDAETVAKLVVKVDSILQKLYSSYNLGGDDGKLTKNDSQADSVGKETHKRKMLDNYLQQKHLFVTEKKNDLERYLADEPINPMTCSFSILDWWKENSGKYKYLSLMAKDILVIPVSTVASESAFSTSGRILDSFRSSLSPKMLEALVCTQSWLKQGYAGIKSREHLDEAEYYKFLEEDAGKKANAMSNEAINVD